MSEQTLLGFSCAAGSIQMDRMPAMCLIIATLVQLNRMTEAFCTFMGVCASVGNAVGQSLHAHSYAKQNDHRAEAAGLPSAKGVYLHLTLSRACMQESFAECYSPLQLPFHHEGVIVWL